MSYISSLNLLNTDSPVPHSEDTFADDLALWANAQFTFDSAPGSALLDDDKKEENEKLFASLTDFTLENQQQEQQEQPSPTTYLPTNYMLSQLQQQQTTPSPVTPITPAHLGLPRLAPAPTEQQLHHQVLQQHGQYIDTLTLSPQQDEAGKPINNKRPLRDNETDQDSSRSTAATAAEDDKRRRNTAASARFRQKKKLREQALEKTAKEMSAKCDTLDKRVRELEMEAKWLRALVVEKNPSLLADKPDSSDTDSSKTITTTSS
ncbi:hypothetical protein BC941DRAFT_513285 [Chlamydoabsidia padenii]|nr:hypothetical protein BC941DRAFT_513285 [Chlamydoabsidia padenii]